ncbi:GNAT family N-acetyltransferase [Shewanella sp. cp20]|uniref:GNAT family N-acetyltransferase n=1 Tax=Shewanella sp. cp20 TaxID=1521167 RepID=UPI0005A1A53A|nr:GNAT family N-acetyltransferase [Shewanella sp. cp20]KIO35163.1 GCN5 family acetyltransferase [Shewanella sp. cp20]
MEFCLLADDPSAADTVARWYYDQWCRASGRHSFQFVRENVSSATCRLGAPMIVLAKQKGELVGAAELKIREMEMFPEYEFWLGGVYVREQARGQGVASALVKEVLRQARRAGIAMLYLQTEDLSGGLYTQFGFRHLEQVDSKGVLVTVMVAETGV